MIIRSQDKTRITSDLNFNIVHFTIFEPELWSIKNSIGCFGEYTTEEKALKVLDMICDACRNVAFTDGVVFRMPADEDVEV